MARRKALAIADLKQGKQYRDKQAAELDNIPIAARAAANREIGLSTNPKQFCKNISTQPSLVLAVQFQNKVKNVITFPAGYKWSPPGCEYTLLFPVQPEIEFITVDGISNIRAMTPEKESVPGSLSASCWESRLPQIQTARILKARGEKLSQYGVTDIQWSKSFTQLGYKLVANGIKQDSGISFAYRKVFLIGERSVVEILGIEWASEYPSVQLIEFEDTIAKHQ